MPLKGPDQKETPTRFHLHVRSLKVFKSRPLPEGTRIKDGTNFSRDRRADWFLNVCVELVEVVQVVQTPTRAPDSGVEVGIDLGLEDFATLSDGHKTQAPRLCREAEDALATAQRA